MFLFCWYGWKVAAEGETVLIIFRPLHYFDDLNICLKYFITSLSMENLLDLLCVTRIKYVLCVSSSGCKIYKVTTQEIMRFKV